MHGSELTRAAARRRRSTRARRRRSRSAWSARNRSRAAGRRRRVRGHPAVPRRRPAAPDQLAGLAAQPASCTSITSPAEEDSGVLLVVDALGGPRAVRRRRRRGQQPRPDGARRGRARRAPRPRRATGSGCGSSAADGALVGSGAGTPAPAADPRPAGRGPPRRVCATTSAGRLQLRVTGGTRRARALADAVATRSARRPRPCQRRGLPVVVVDTLPDDVGPAVAGRHRPAASPTWPGGCGGPSASSSSTALARAGCPVVAWRGPGTLDDVLRRLARRAQLPAGAVPMTFGVAGAGAGGQWLLRAVVLLGPLAGAAGAGAERRPPRLWLVLLTAALAAGCGRGTRVGGRCGRVAGGGVLLGRGAAGDLPAGACSRPGSRCSRLTSPRSWRRTARTRCRSRPPVGPAVAAARPRCCCWSPRSCGLAALAVRELPGVRHGVAAGAGRRRCR